MYTIRSSCRRGISRFQSGIRPTDAYAEQCPQPVEGDMARLARARLLTDSDIGRTKIPQRSSVPCGAAMCYCRLKGKELASIKRRYVMHSTLSRRGFLTTLSSAGVAGLTGTRGVLAQEAPPEVTTVRLAKNQS